MKQMKFSSHLKVLTSNSRTRVLWRVSQFRCFSERRSSREINKEREVGKQFRTRDYQAEKKLDDFPTKVLKKFKKLQKRPAYQAPPIGYKKTSQEAYKNLIYKWILEAYPESLSRTELAGKLRAHPKKVKTLILEPLLQEGKLLKWGSRVAPRERYMPNVKAPEYYEVTGEKGPVVPDVNEEELLLRMQPKHEQAPKNEKGIKLKQDLQTSKDKPSMTEQGWQDLFEDTDDEEDEDEEDYEEDDDDEEEDDFVDYDEPKQLSSNLQDFDLEDDDLEGVNVSDISDGEDKTQDSEDSEDEDDDEEDDGEFLFTEALEASDDKFKSKKE